MISLLIHWYKKHARKLPWRIDGQPYHVWVSEIILQQTQMSRGVDYFQRFIKQFPDVYSLSSADEHDVLLYYDRDLVIIPTPEYLLTHQQSETAF